MAHEIRTSEAIVLHGKDIFIAGLDGDPRPELIADVQAAQKRVDEAAVLIHDQSPEAFARRKPFILSELEKIRSQFGEEHPFYRKRFRDAKKGGYLPEPTQFRTLEDRFRTISDIRERVAV